MQQPDDFQLPALELMEGSAKTMALLVVLFRKTLIEGELPLEEVQDLTMVWLESVLTMAKK